MELSRRMFNLGALASAVPAPSAPHVLREVGLQDVQLVSPLPFSFGTPWEGLNEFRASCQSSPGADWSWVLELTHFKGSRWIRSPSDRLMTYCLLTKQGPYRSLDVYSWAERPRPPGTPFRPAMCKGSWSFQAPEGHIMTYSALTTGVDIYALRVDAPAGHPEAEALLRSFEPT